MTFEVRRELLEVRVHLPSGRSPGALIRVGASEVNKTVSSHARRCDDPRQTISQSNPDIDQQDDIS